MMFQDYFIFNGKKYYTGTVFITNYMGKPVEAYFVCYDTKRCYYVYKIGNIRQCSYDEIFWRNFISITNKRNDATHVPIKKVKRDIEIEGLFIGWVWYVFLMSISIIFNDAIGLWIFISIVFFSWRSKKIKEEGTYHEW